MAAQLAVVQGGSTLSGPADGYQAADKPDINRKQRWFRAWETNKRKEMQEQREARQYYHDKQWTDEEIQKLRARGQQPTVRNRIKRKVDFIVGTEQRMRRDPKAYPRTPQHEHDADTATAGLRFATDLNRWDKVASAVMHDGVVSGIGVAFIGIERGDPKLKAVAIDRFFYDPRSVEPDFSDARYMGLHLWFDIDDATDQWPDHKDRLEAMVDASSMQTAATADQDKEQQWGDFEARRVRVVEFWEKRNILAKGPAWYYCYFTGELVLESGWSPYLDYSTDQEGRPDCPYEAWSPYVDEKGDRYGLVRTMKSIQDEINYSASKILHRISADRFFYEEGTIEDVDELGKQLARPDGKIRITRGEWGKNVGVVDQGAKIQGEAERFQMAVMEMENLGPNPGLIGQGEGVDGASGRALSMQRDSGMTELQPVFDRFRDWKLRVYRKLWNRCRQAWQGEKWIRITDDERSVQFVGLNQYQIDPMSGQIVAQNVVAQIDVDITLEEGPDTLTVNEELLERVTNLGEAAMSPVGKLVIELSNTPKKEQLLKMIDDAMAQMAAPPPPDPMVELKAQELQIRTQEMQHKGQMDQQKAEIDRDTKLIDRDMKLIDKDIKEMELQAKQVEIGVKLEADREQRQHDETQREFEREKMTRDAELRESDHRRATEQKEADHKRAADMEDRKARANGHVTKEEAPELRKILAALSAPKRVIRDPETGKAMGVEPVLMPETTTTH